MEFRADFRSDFQVTAVIMLLVLSLDASAQSTIDPSSALLLSPGSRTTGRTSDKSTNDARADSTRYTVRPRAQGERVEKVTPPKHASPESTTAATPSPTPAPVVLAPTDKGSVVVLVDPPQTEVLPVDPVTPVAPSKTNDHLLEVSIASGYLYENADSNYSFRHANMGGPAYAASARTWLIPEFAVGGRFLSTLGGQVSDRGTAVSASRTELGYGIYLRKRFASSYLVFGAEYVDSEFKVSSDTVSKLKTKSGGVRVSIESEFRSAEGAWGLGFSLMPKLQHEEISAATEVRSGTSANAYAVGASISRSWNFDASNKLFIRLEHRLERDLFTGTATIADPIGGATPNGVSATVGTTLIQFGYGWGN